MMTDFNPAAIVPESFVLIDGYWYHVETTVDHNGYFFASDVEGEDYEWYVDQVDDVMEVL